jgi:hypothetical protein
MPPRRLGKAKGKATTYGVVRHTCTKSTEKVEQMIFIPARHCSKPQVQVFRRHEEHDLTYMQHAWMPGIDRWHVGEMKKHPWYKMMQSSADSSVE